MASPSIPASVSRSIGRACQSYVPRSSASCLQAHRLAASRSSPLVQVQSFSSALRSSTHLARRVPSQRAFSTTPSRPAKTVEQMRTRASTGPFSWKAGLLFVVTGGALVVYFQYEKARMERRRVAEMSKGVGKPKVGGPFVLRDLDGNEVTEDMLKGRYSFVYFGFTHCPDICPDELDKMAHIIDLVRERFDKDNVMQPVFITCDPARDTPEVLRKYLTEFHPDIIGLTGTYEQVKDVCKQYRVYFSTPKDVKPGEDYLVDHSIYFYLMDPEGDFVECIGRQDTAESATKVIADHINDWKKEGKPMNTGR